MAATIEAHILLSLAQATDMQLIGRTLMTERMGDWPGGRAKIVGVYPDPAAPEILFEVEHERADVRDRFPTMGVFEFEKVNLL